MQQRAAKAGLGKFEYHGFRSQEGSHSFLILVSRFIAV